MKSSLGDRHRSLSEAVLAEPLLDLSERFGAAIAGVSEGIASLLGQGHRPRSIAAAAHGRIPEGSREREASSCQPVRGDVTLLPHNHRPLS